MSHDSNLPTERASLPSTSMLVSTTPPEEASVLYQITAFCYNGQGGLLQLEDGNSLTILPMTDSDRRLTGAAKRKCVAAQVRRVYKAFKAEGANAVQPGELQAVGVDHPNSVSLNPADATHGAPLLVSPTHNSETGIAPCGNHGLDSLCEMCIVGLGFSPGDGVHAVDSQAFNRDANNFQEVLAASNTESGMSFSSDKELVLLRILVSSQQEVISLQRQQLQFLRRDISNTLTNSSETLSSCNSRLSSPSCEIINAFSPWNLKNSAFITFNLFRINYKTCSLIKECLLHRRVLTTTRMTYFAI